MRGALFLQTEAKYVVQVIFSSSYLRRRWTRTCFCHQRRVEASQETFAQSGDNFAGHPLNLGFLGQLAYNRNEFRHVGVIAAVQKCHDTAKSSNGRRQFWQDSLRVFLKIIISLKQSLEGSERLDRCYFVK